MPVTGQRSGPTGLWPRPEPVWRSRGFWPSPCEGWETATRLTTWPREQGAFASAETGCSVGKPTEAVLVVGGTGALGGVLVPRLARAGYHVMVYSRRPVAGERYELPNVTVHVGELDDDWFSWRLINETQDYAQRLRGAVFINGSYRQDRGVGASQFTQYLRDLMEDNVYPVTRLLEVLGPFWRQQLGGRLVVTSAAAAERPTANRGAYAIAKAAVRDVARQVGVEFQPEEIEAHVLAPRIIGERIGQNTPLELSEEALAFLRAEPRKVPATGPIPRLHG